MNCCSTSGIHRKFIMAYQIIYQALQSFHNHITLNTLPNGIQQKLTELINKCHRFCDLHLATLKDNNYHTLDDLIMVIIMYYLLYLLYLFYSIVEFT